MRRSAVALGTVALLLWTALPALAAASFTTGGEAQAASEAHDVTLAVAEVPAEDDTYGETVRVRLTAPAGFAVTCGSMPVDWECTAEEGALTWSRRVLARTVDQVEFGFTTSVPAVNGSYAFTVRQSDEPAEGEEATTVTAGRPAITVVGGQEPEPEPTPAPEPSPSPTATDAADDRDDATTEPSPEPVESSEPADDPSEPEPDEGDDEEDADDADDEPAARPTTREQSNSTTLGVSPVSPSVSPRPEVDGPAVADDPVIGTPDTEPEQADDQDATVAATGSDPAQGSPGMDVPWQQWVGGALLLAGGLVLLWRRFGDRLPALALPDQLPRLPWRD